MHIGLIVVNFEYLPTLLCNLFSNTDYLRIGFFASFPVHLVGQKTQFRLYLGHNLLENTNNFHIGYVADYARNRVLSSSAPYT